MNANHAAHDLLEALGRGQNAARLAPKVVNFLRQVEDLTKDLLSTPLTDWQHELQTLRHHLKQEVNTAIKATAELPAGRWFNRSSKQKLGHQASLLSIFPQLIEYGRTLDQSYCVAFLELVIEAYLVGQCRIPPAAKPLREKENDLPYKLRHTM